MLFNKLNSASKQNSGHCQGNQMCIRVAFTITLAARQRSAYKLKFDSLTQELRRKVVKAKGEPLTASEWARGKRAFSISSLSRFLAVLLASWMARSLVKLTSQPGAAKVTCCSNCSLRCRCRCCFCCCCCCYSALSLSIQQVCWAKAITSSSLSTVVVVDSGLIIPRGSTTGV